MKIIRWQSEILPTKEHIKLILENEGVEPFEENFEPGLSTQEHRHPFTEVRMIVEGELLFNISGNQLMLRPGDRIEIPANTKHIHSAKGNQNAISICGYKPT